MNNRLKLEQKVIALSAQVIRLFYNRKVSEMIPLLDNDFLWIGTYSFQWAQGLDSFIKITNTESKELPPVLSNENYHLQLQSGNIWIICGNYTTTYQVDTGYLCQDMVRITFVWEQNEHGFKLNHIHGSNVQDLSVAITNAASLPSGSFYQYVKKAKTSAEDSNFNPTVSSKEPELQSEYNEQNEMLILKDESERYHNLLPMEILYLEAANQWCHVYTPFENFLTFGSLTSFEQKLSGFTRIHRSYLVNTQAIVKLRFGKLWLWNDTVLPVSKGRYPEVKQLLDNSSEASDDQV